MYIHVPFGHAVFIKRNFGKSSVISDQASMYMFSLVSVFCSRLFSVKQLKFERSSSDKAYIFPCDMITKTKFSDSPNDFKIHLFG